MGFAFLDRELRFVRVNEQLAEINGCSVEAHLGRTVAELLPSLDVALREVTARILASGQPVLDREFSGETARAPGVTRYWNASWYPVRDEHSEIIGFSGVVVEITERKQAAALYLQTQNKRGGQHDFQQIRQESDVCSNRQLVRYRCRGGRRTIAFCTAGNRRLVAGAAGAYSRHGGKAHCCW